MTDIQGLTYNDADRADVVDWLNSHGWRASGQPSDAEMRRLGRWIDIPTVDDQSAFATFVVAARTG